MAATAELKIVEHYSHLNGLEYLLVHKPHLWEEIKAVIAGIDANVHKVKVSKEKNMAGSLLFSPTHLNKAFHEAFGKADWKPQTTRYWVTDDVQLIRKTVNLTPKEQKVEIEAAGKKPILSFNQTDFVKERVAVEVQFGKYSFVAYDLFVKHWRSLSATRSILAWRSSR
jgi:Restriction endonuclease BglII